jgi:hypothetical protein
MRRWLFHIAAGSSLLLCLALLALWINSLSQQYMFDVQFPDSPNASPYVLRLISLRSAEGGFWIHEQVITVTSPPEIATYAAVSGASIRTNFGTVQNPPMYTGLSQLKFDWAPRFVNASDPGVTQTKAWLPSCPACGLPGIAATSGECLRATASIAATTCVPRRSGARNAGPCRRVRRRGMLDDGSVVAPKLGRGPIKTVPGTIS